MPVADAYPTTVSPSSISRTKLIRLSALLIALAAVWGLAATHYIGGSAPRPRRVVVASSFGAHDDVYMSVVDTLERVLTPGSVRVYTHGLRYGLGEDILERVGVYAGSSYMSAYELPGAVNSAWDGLGAELVILGTCEVDLPTWGPDLFKLWLARAKEDKFDLVCIVHNTGDYNWRENFAMDWARVGALSLLPISAHTTIAQHARMLQLSDDFDRYHLGLSEVPVRTHIPILPIERLPSFNAHGRHPGSYVHSDREKGDGLGEKRAMETPSSDWTGPVDTHWGRRDGKVLRDAVIQGGFDRGRRDYEGVMKDLLAELEADPAAWGYKPASEGAPFVPANVDNFVLHLAGDGDETGLVPDRLKNVVRVHKHLSYPDFFNLMSSMDLAVPAFSMGAYMVDIASSTVAMAMQVETPLLVTPRILSAYTYLTPATTVVRPPTMREVSAVKALRTGRCSPPSRNYDHSHEQSFTDVAGFKGLGVWKGTEAWAGTPLACERMITGGWTRGEGGWAKFKGTIYRENEKVMREALAL